MKNCVLLFLSLTMFAGCGIARNKPAPVSTDTINILTLDKGTLLTSGGEMGGLPDPSTIVPAESAGEGGGGGGSVAFTFAGKSSSFTFTSKSSALTVGGQAKSFSFGGASSTFKASVPTPKSSDFGGGSSGNCDWESSIRAFFSKMMEASGATKATATAGAAATAAADAQFEAMVAGLRPYFASADPRAVCIIADFYQCVADSLTDVKAMATQVATCAQDACMATGATTCAAVNASAGNEGE